MGRGERVGAAGCAGAPPPRGPSLRPPDRHPWRAGRPSLPDSPDGGRPGPRRTTALKLISQVRNSTAGVYQTYLEPSAMIVSGQRSTHPQRVPANIHSASGSVSPEYLPSNRAFSGVRRRGGRGRPRHRHRHRHRHCHRVPLATVPHLSDSASREALCQTDSHAPTVPGGGSSLTRHIRPHHPVKHTKSKSPTHRRSTLVRAGPGRTGAAPLRAAAINRRRLIPGDWPVRVAGY